MSTHNEFVLRLASGLALQLKDGATLRAEDLVHLKTTSPDGTFAEVSQNPNDPTVLGLKNLSQQAWTVTLVDGSQRQVEFDRNIKLVAGAIINFGPVVGTIRERTGQFSVESVSGTPLTLRVGQRITTSDLLGQSGGGPIAEVSRNPNNPTVLGLKNLTRHTWTAVIPDSGQRSIAPGKTIRLAAGTTINFDGIIGEVKATTRRSSWFYSLPSSFRHIQALRTVGNKHWKVSVAAVAALFLAYIGWATLLFPTWFEHRMRAALKVEEAKDPAIIEQVRQIAKAPTTLALAAQLEQQLSQGFTPPGGPTAANPPGSGSVEVSTNPGGPPAFPEPSATISDLPTPPAPPLPEENGLSR